MRDMREDRLLTDGEHGQIAYRTEYNRSLHSYLLRNNFRRLSRTQDMNSNRGGGMPRGYEPGIRETEGTMAKLGLREE